MPRNEIIFLLTAMFFMILILINIVNQSSNISNHLYYINKSQSEAEDRFLKLEENLSSIKGLFEIQGSQSKNNCKKNKSSRDLLLEAAYILNRAVRNYKDGKKKLAAINEIKKAKKLIWQASDKKNSYSKPLKKMMSPIDGLIKKINSNKPINDIKGIVDKLDAVIGEIK